MEHEIRYRGELLGHFPSSDAALKHLNEHHTGTSHLPNRPPGEKHVDGKYRLDHHSQTPDDFVISPRRPIELHCRGNLVDTFDTSIKAAAKRDELIAEHERIFGDRFGSEKLSALHFEITDPHERAERERVIQEEDAARKIAEATAGHNLEEQTIEEENPEDFTGPILDGPNPEEIPLAVPLPDRPTNPELPSADTVVTEKATPEAKKEGEEIDG